MRKFLSQHYPLLLVIIFALAVVILVGDDCRLGFIGGCYGA